MAILLEIMPDGIRQKWNRWHFRNFQLDKKMERSSIAAFDYYKCIYVHIPKTGGISVNDALWGNPGGVHKTMEQYARIFSPQTLEEYFKFAIVRNPWDRLVSAFFFLKDGGKHSRDAKWAEDHLSSFDEFEDFVLNWLNEENIHKGIHFIPQADFLKLNGSIKVDFIGSLESIEEDFDHIKQKIGLENARLPHKNRSARADYRTYYTEETKNKVAKLYAEDIALKNYHF